MIGIYIIRLYGFAINSVVEYNRVHAIDDESEWNGLRYA